MLVDAKVTLLALRQMTFLKGLIKMFSRARLIKEEIKQTKKKTHMLYIRGLDFLSS